MNLLIVNDEQLTAETMKKDMDWASYGISEVYTAYDTEAARACIAEHPVDILLCDIEMPGENGLGLLRWVREQEKEIECIFLTCHAKFAYAQEAIILGCQDYILIPARYEDIGEKIRKVVDRIRGKRDTARYEEYGRQLFQEKIHEGEASESPQRRVQPEETAEEVCRYILKELKNSELNVERIAEEFHFHPAYLNRLFKKEKGVSVGQFLINGRMKLREPFWRPVSTTPTRRRKRWDTPITRIFTTCSKNTMGCPLRNIRKIS